MVSVKPASVIQQGPCQARSHDETFSIAHNEGGAWRRVLSITGKTRSLQDPDKDLVSQGRGKEQFVFIYGCPACSKRIGAEPVSLGSDFQTDEPCSSVMLP